MLVRRHWAAVFAIGVVVLLLSGVAGQVPYKAWRFNQLSRCTDLGEYPQYEGMCTFRTQAQCGLSGSFTSPCGQGNGDCFLTSGAYTCANCAQTAPTFLPFPEESLSAWNTDNCDAASSTLNLAFQVQPFLLGYPNASEPEMIVPLPAKVEKFSAGATIPSRNSVSSNTFQDGFERSAPLFSDGESGAFSSNLYYSVFIVDAVDSQSNGGNVLFSSPNNTDSAVVPSMQVGIGIALQQPSTPASPFNTPKTGAYQVDPLGAVSAVYAMSLTRSGNQFAGFLEQSMTTGILNFTTALAEVKRYMHNNTFSPAMTLSFQPSELQGEISLVLHPKIQRSRAQSSTYTNVAMTASVPVELSAVLELPPARIVQDPAVFAPLSATKTSTALYGGSFPRTFSMSVGDSRRITTTLLHKNWNVFTAGSNDRATSFALSPMATASLQPRRHLLVPTALFSSAAEKAQVLARVGEPLAQFYFELVHPIRIHIVPNVAKIIEWSDRTFDLIRLQVADSVRAGVTPPPTPTSLSATDPFAVLQAYLFPTGNVSTGSSSGTSFDATVVSYQRVSDGQWVSAVYRQNQTSLLFFGPNSYAQFGQGDSTAAEDYPITSDPVNPVNAEIQSVGIGETHVVLVTTDGQVFAAGLMPANQSIDCRDDPTADVRYPRFQQIFPWNTSSWLAHVNGSNVSVVPTSVIAGFQYTAFLVRVLNTTHNGTNVTTVTTSRVMVCGGSFMTGQATGNLTDMTATGLPWSRSVVYNGLLPGRYHFCVTHSYNATGSLAAYHSPQGTPTSTVICHGRLDTNLASPGTNAGPSAATPFWSSRNGTVPIVTTTPFAIPGVESVSVGQHHVVLTVREGMTDAKFASGPYASRLSVLTSGSNTFGQLGASLFFESSADIGVAHPRFSFPERVSSTRGPNIYHVLNAELSQLDVERNYQLFETATAQAIQNTTVVMQRLRVFNSPNYFLKNFSATVHRRPPDGKYLLTQIFADIVPEWKPYDRGPDTATLPVSNLTQLVWNVRFSLVKGLALFLVQNQSVSDGHWRVPAASVTSPEQQECTLGRASGFEDFQISSGDGAGTFYRDWSLLRRNITRYVNKPISVFNATHNVTQSLITVLVPSVFFLASNGSIYPLSTLSNNCGGRNNSWCDTVSRTVVCNWGEPSPPAGYQKSVGGGAVKWMAMYVSVEAINVTTTSIRPWTVSNTTSASSSSSDVVTVTEANMIAAVGSTAWNNRYWYWFCTPKINIYDCSSLAFFQAFFPDRRSPSSYFAFSEGGLTHQYLPLGGGVGMLQLSLSTSARRIFNQCVFLKYGRFYYYVMLVDSSLSFGSIVICSFRGLSRNTHTATFTASLSLSVNPGPAPTEGPQPATPAPTPATPNFPPSLPYQRWELDTSTSASGGNTILRLRNVDRKNNLVPSTFYTNSTPSTVLDPYNLTMVVGPHGAVARGFDGSDQPTAYMMFWNESVEGLLWEQQGVSPSGGAMASSSTHFISPGGSYGSHFVPVIPIVAQFNTMVFYVQPTAAFGPNDALVFRIHHRNDDTLPALQFSIGANGTSLESVDDTIRLRSAIRRFYWGMCVTRASSDAVLASARASPNAFYCTPRPLAPTMWTRILLQEDTFGAGMLKVFMNSALVAAGRFPSFSSFFRNVRGVRFTVRNRWNTVAFPINVRELAFCLDYASVGIANGPNPFPCAVGTKPLERFGFSASHSATITVSKSESSTMSLTASQSFTVSSSSSTTDSLTTTLSTTKDVTASVSNSFTFTLSNASASTTVVATPSHSKTGTIQKNVSVFVVSMSSALTAYNIRRSGVPILVALREDEFNPLSDLQFQPNAYMSCTSNVSVADNPSGFCPSFAKRGFASGLVDPSNRSRLEIVFGPASFYNAYQDEAVVLTVLSSAAASEFTVPGEIRFTVAGLGYAMNTKLRLTEAAGGAAALLGLLVGGPASNVIRIATNSIFLNFHCFNNEVYPLSWITSPTAVSVQGNTKLGVAFVNIGLLVGVFALHFVIVCLVFAVKKDTFLKAQGDVYFPGLSFGLTAILLPGYITGSWQGAVASGNAGFIVFLALVMVVVVLGPIIFLIHNLYDAANFSAKYVSFHSDVVRSFTVEFPVVSRFIPPGVWRSTDRHFSFTRRFHHLIWEFRSDMAHWFCVEFGEAIAVGSIAALTNDSPVACVSQLCCFLAIKCAVLVGLVLARPHSTPLGQFPATIVGCLQAASLLLALIDTAKGGTQAYELAYVVTLFTICMLLAVHSLLTTAVLAYYRWLRWRERSLMTSVAAAYAKQKASAVESPPKDTVCGAGGGDGVALSGGGGGGGGEGGSARTIRYMPDGTMAFVSDVPIAVMLKHEDTADDGALGDKVAHSARDPDRDISRSSAALSDFVGRGPTTAVRDFWQLAALESITGEPVVGITYHDDADLL